MRITQLWAFLKPLFGIVTKIFILILLLLLTILFFILAHQLPILKEPGEMEPYFHFDKSGILGVPVELDVINLDTKVFHLDEEVIHGL